ncbi:hypothetical protein PRZ48_010561 [Zasmidium cellare]|uniref:Uncharacterized protein n=1 Tax=Zasmidium cellare TaxID=395010 RepID=A0ABR0E9L9_ZASCE|nr:hypothetical protein PRZ48_010561 [Zasmidium cellare]
MFDWYRESAKCYAFLDDVKAGNDAKAFARVPREGVSTVETLPGEGSGPKYSVWFVRRLLKTQTEQTTDLTQTRGWTLQELLAPKVMDFFDQHWKLIGSRSRRAPQIRQITGIDEQFLEGKDRLEDASMATKMSWMAGRTTGFVEDIAYSLIGLFGISMQPMYGEGIKAFTRLQEALLTDPSFDESLLAWQSGVVLRCFGEEAEWKVDEWGFLAPSPDCFTLSRDLAKAENPVRLGGGFRPSGQGINVSLPVMELRTFFRGDLKEITFPLNCTRDGKTIVLRLMRPSTKSLAWRRTDCSAPLREKAKAKVGDNRHWGVNLPLGRQITVESSYYSL